MTEKNRKKITFFFVETKLDYIFASAIARIAQLVEHNLAKVGVAGSNPVSRSFLFKMF